MRHREEEDGEAGWVYINHPVRIALIMRQNLVLGWVYRVNWALIAGEQHYGKPKRS